MFNRMEYGLHHPGNIVPCCKTCNKRERKDNKEYTSWLEHLRIVCTRQNELDLLPIRQKRIEDSISNENYPKLDSKEQHAIRVIANSLYENIKSESNKSLELYKELDKAFIEHPK